MRTSLNEKEQFSYQMLIKDFWVDKMKKAKNKFNVWFDLENNDAANKTIRKIEIPQTHWEHTKCRFMCQLWSAGGDWEHPVYYFRCQTVDGYAYDPDFGNLSTYSNSHFIFIPGKTQGNYHLVKGQKDKWIAPHDGDYKKGIDPERNEQAAWKSLKEFLTTLVDNEIKRIEIEKENRG